MSDEFDPAAVAAADQDLARLNRMLDAMIHAWAASKPTLVAEYPDPMTQIAALSYTLFVVAQPEQARTFAQQYGVNVTLPATPPFLHPADLPCLLAIAINRLSKVDR